MRDVRFAKFAAHPAHHGAVAGVVVGVFRTQADDAAVVAGPELVGDGRPTRQALFD